MPLSFRASTSKDRIKSYRANVILITVLEEILSMITNRDVVPLHEVIIEDRDWFQVIEVPGAQISRSMVRSTVE